MDEDIQDEYKKAHDKAADLLSRRLHTKKELEKKLKLKKFSQTAIEKVLTRFIELKILNDDRFAEIFLTNLIRYKSYGYYALKQKLLQRGIENSLADKLLEENLSVEDEINIAKKVANKGAESKEKLILKLKRKGFRNEVISKIVSNQEFEI
jgi:regulatory protein